MRTRSSSNLPVESPPNPSTSNLKRRNRRRSKQPFILEEYPIDTMVNQRTMAEFLRAPTKGYAEAIVVPSILAEQFKLKHSLINMMTLDHYSQIISSNPTSSSVKAVEEICVTFGGAYPNYQCLTTGGNTFPELRDNIQRYVAAAAVNYNQEDERVEETLTDQDLAEYTIKVPPPLAKKPKPPSQRNFVMHQRDPLHPNIPYPSRMLKQKQQEKNKVQIHIFWQMFKQLYINITLTDALILMPKYQKMIKDLLSNKEKLLELANTPLNENCSAVILKKLHEKLGDLGKFLIPCSFNDVFDLDHLLKPLFPSPIPVEDIDSFLEKSDTSLSLLEYETFINHTEETSSGSTTTHVDYSLPKYDSFIFKIKPDQGKSTSVVRKDNLTEPRVHVPNVLTTHPTLMLDSDFIPSDNSLQEYEIFYFDTEEKNSGSTTIHADISLSDLECFNFDFKPDLGELISIVDSRIHENVPSATNVNLPHEKDHSPLFAYVV
nr:reverse transcriptase domain-containing protein [Tanacetum cinerariifolium]